MKTQMHVKPDALERMNDHVRKKNIDRRKNRPAVYSRIAGCAALIAILAASGYVGAYRQNVQKTTAAPVVSRQTAYEEYEEMSFEEIENRLEQERAQELALLDGVIDDVGAQDSTKENARQQKIQIVERMETQAQIRAALTSMGIAEAMAICTQERVMLIIPAQYAQRQTQMIDAACSISGCEAKDVKIILVKK